MGALRRRFGARVRQIRKAQGLTQQELAGKARMDYKYIGAVERGERNLTIDNVERIIAALGADPYEPFLFDLHDRPERPVDDARIVGRLVRHAGPAARPLVVAILQDVLRWTEGRRKRNAQ